MGQKYIGERFGDYKLVRLLGEGGFASVYLGEEVHNGTLAAVKLLKEQKVHDFINEVSRTNRLQHPNIVKVLDFGIRTSDDTAFIVMEYAPNGSFREKYPRDTRIPLDVVVLTVKQVASALQYAHDQRVIHRDVKPENLLLNARNMVLLSDFGIATASRTAMTAYAGQAGQGDIIGTYAYMAPEQLIGRPVSASDQYSLAIMVYEWLCGTLPFEAREYIQWHYLHEKVPPPALREHIPSLVPAVEQVVLKALAKKPEERFERVKTFASALERAARREDVSPEMSTPGPTIHSTQVDSTLAGKQDNVLAQTPANPTEQLFQEGVRAQANAKIEEAFRIWQQIINTPGVAERYSTPAQKRVQELRIEMISLRRKQAQEANMQGRWQDEIRLWEDLLALEPSPQDLAPLLKSPLTLGEATSNIKKSIQERLRIAHQNEQFAWMYTGAQQFIHNKDNASARTQLQMLWQDVPYYGDPSDLAQMLGLPAPLNYEQTIVAEQARLEQGRLARERQEQEWQEQGRLARERQEQERQEQERLARERQEQERQEQERLARKNLIVVIMLVIGGIVGSIIVGKIGEAKGGTIGAAIGGTVGAAIGAAIGRIIGGRGAIGILEALIGAIVGAIVGVGIAIIGVGVGLGGLTVLIGIAGVIGGVIGGGAGGFLGGVAQTVEEGESTGGGISGGIVGGIVGGVVGGLVGGVVGGLVGGVVGGLVGGGLVGSLVGGVVGGLVGGGTGGGLMGGALRVEKAPKKH